MCLHEASKVWCQWDKKNENLESSAFLGSELCTQVPGPQTPLSRKWWKQQDQKFEASLGNKTNPEHTKFPHRLGGLGKPELPWGFFFGGGCLLPSWF